MLEIINIYREKANILSNEVDKIRGLTERLKRIKLCLQDVRTGSSVIDVKPWIHVNLVIPYEEPRFSGEKEVKYKEYNLNTKVLKYTSDVTLWPELSPDIIRLLQDEERKTQEAIEAIIERRNLRFIKPNEDCKKSLKDAMHLMEKNTPEDNKDG